MSREKVIEFIYDLPKSPKDMAERFKKIPFSHKLFGAITTAGLVACGVGEKIGIVTPPPEGTATNPPPTEITPTLENQTVFGSGEFMTGDPALSEMLQTSLREGFNIEIPEEATIPFSLKVGEAKFDFVSLAPLENTELGISWNEKLFIKVNETMADLDRQEVTIDGNNLIMWSYLNTNNNQMEPVLWYPSLTNQEWESLTPEQKSNFYAGFAPPSPLEGQVPGYTRTLDQVFTIAFGELPESALKVRAVLRPLTPVPEGLNNLPEGFVPVRNEDGTWGIGIIQEGQTVTIPDVSFDSTGLHIAEVVDIKPEDIAKRLKVGQNSPFQIYNEQGTAILYAYDTENKVLINSADVLQPDNSNPENYIKYDTLDDWLKSVRLEKMVVTPFDPTNTYFPDLASIYSREWNNLNSSYAVNSEFDFYSPFGSLPENMQSPFRFPNFVNIGNGQAYGYIEQIYNLDGSFTLLHCVTDAYPEIITDIRIMTSPRRYEIPIYYADEWMLNNYFWLESTITWLKANNYIDASGNMPKVKQLVDEWLATGYLSSQIENIPAITRPKYFSTK